MWVKTFTTRQGDICLRFGSRVMSVQACAAAKGVTELVRRHPTIATTAAVLLPILLQLYLASKQTEDDTIEAPHRSR